MFDFLEKLRQKPEAVRVRYAVIFAALVTGLIFLVWLSVLGVRLSNSPASDAVLQGSSPFGTLKESVGSFFEAGREQIEGVRESLDATLPTASSSSESTESPPQNNENML